MAITVAIAMTDAMSSAGRVENPPPSKARTDSHATVTVS
jgi:hypothetical protein